MRVILKPMGAVALLAAIGILTYLTIRTSAPPVPTKLPQVAPGQVPATDGSGGKMVNAVGSDRTQGQMQIIFTDGFESGWILRGWAKDARATEEKTVYGSAGKTIAATFASPNKFEGVKLHHEPFDSAPFDRLTFRIHGGEKGGQKLRVSGLLRDKEQKSAELAPVPPGKWVTVSVPLADLGVATRFTADGFTVQSQDAKPQATIYIDDVRLLTPRDPAPETAEAPLLKIVKSRVPVAP